MEEVPKELKAYALIKNTRLLQLSPSEDMVGAVSSKPNIFVLLDRSGSMDAWCEHAVSTAIPSALQQQGYNLDDQITLITFDSTRESEFFFFVLVLFDVFLSKAERILVNGKNPKISDLSKLGVRCRGCTNMGGAMRMLTNLLEQEEQAAHIIVISDGAISDQIETAMIASDAVDSLKGKKISATLLRLMTSQNAQPDTRAMSCIGQFCNNVGGTAIIDIACFDGGYATGILNLTQSISEGCQTAGVGASIELSTVQKKPIFQLTPTSEGLSSVLLPCSNRNLYVMITEACDHVTLGDVQYRVIDCGVPKTIEELETFVHFITQPLKIQMLAGGKQSNLSLKRTIEETLSFLEQLEAMIVSVHEKALGGDSVDLPIDLSVAGRARGIVKSIKASAGSIVSQLRQELNLDRVAGLNAQQTADFLRPVSQSKSGRALAKRAGETDLSSDSAKGILALSEMMKSPDAPKENDESPCSFYSLSNFHQCLSTAGELALVKEDCNLRWLECIGGVGVPFTAHLRDYPMPWNLRLSNLFPGQVLAEPDVFLACVQSGSNTGSIECPGQPGRQITGVIVLQDIDPECYRLYQKGPVRQLALMQCSAQIRHTIAPMPFDDIALNTAGIWWILNHHGSVGRIPTVETELLGSLINNIRVLIGDVYKTKTVERFQEICKDLLRDDPRPWISGDRDFADILQGVAALIRFGSPSDEQNAVDLKPAMRALYSLEAYQAAKRRYRPLIDGQNSIEPRETRESALHNLLQIDFAARGTRTQELFVEEPEVVKHYDMITIEVPQAPVMAINEEPSGEICNQNTWTMPSFMPWIRPYVGLVRQVLKLDVLPSIEDVFGCGNLQLFKTAIAVQSLLCTEESDRIDTAQRISKVVDISSDDLALAYLKDVQRKIYEADYKKRVAGKVLEESIIVTQRTVDSLVAAESMEVFVSQLQTSVILNRNHVGFEPLLKRIADEACPKRLEKLVVLLSGRQANSVEVPIWATGNFYSGKWKHFGALFNDGSDASGPALWKVLLGIHEKFGIYKYPRGASRNRHDHSDSFPSYWAMGYKDLLDMQSKVTDDIFREYIVTHCIAKGCCLPNENQRALFQIRK